MSETWLCNKQNYDQPLDLHRFPNLSPNGTKAAAKRALLAPKSAMRRWMSS